MLFVLSTLFTLFSTLATVALSVLTTLTVAALSFATSTFIWNLYKNRATWRGDTKLFIGSGIADTAALYKRWYGFVLFHLKYFIVYCWLIYIKKSSTHACVVDFAFKFTNTSGYYHVTRATQYTLSDGNKIHITNARDLLRVFLALFPHTVVSYRHFLRTCKEKRIIESGDSYSGNILDIEYAANDGLYSIKFDLEKDYNITANDDLLFGELTIDPMLSSKIAA